MLPFVEPIIRAPSAPARTRPVLAGHDAFETFCTEGGSLCLGLARGDELGRVLLLATGGDRKGQDARPTVRWLGMFALGHAGSRRLSQVTGYTPLGAVVSKIGHLFSSMRGHEQRLGSTATEYSAVGPAVLHQPFGLSQPYRSRPTSSVWALGTWIAARNFAP
jgi:hypothetical protein